jgi:hypothetical protein
VWTFSTGVIEGHEAPPIVNNGVMFIATPVTLVWETGKFLKFFQLAERDFAAFLVAVTRDVVVIRAFNEQANAMLIAEPRYLSESRFDRLWVFQPDYYVSVDK